MAKKQVRRPRKLRIGKKKYRVVSRTRRWDSNRTYGEIDYGAKLIKISEDQTKDRYTAEERIKNTVDTMIHEIFHGIIAEYPTRLDKRREEGFVTDLATGLTDVLLKNPKLLEWVKAMLDDQRDIDPKA